MRFIPFHSFSVFKDQSRNLLELAVNLSQSCEPTTKPLNCVLKVLFHMMNFMLCELCPSRKKNKLLKNKAVPTGEGEAKTAAPSS